MLDRLGRNDPNAWVCDCEHAANARKLTQDTVKIHKELGRCPSCGSTFAERSGLTDD